MGIVSRIKEDLGLPITSLTLRVTDTALGTPAVGMHLTLAAPDGHTLSGRTDEFGRARVDDGLIPGTYTATVEAGKWFAAHERLCGYGDVRVDVDVVSGGSHEVMIGLSGFAYTVTLEPHPYVPPSGA